MIGNVVWGPFSYVFWWRTFATMMASLSAPLMRCCFFLKGMVKKGYCDERRFIAILVIKMELFKQFLGLIFKSISSVLFLSVGYNRKALDLYGKFDSLCFPHKKFRNLPPFSIALVCFKFSETNLLVKFE